MAFQTNVFRNGGWVTESIDLQTVLNAQAPARERSQYLQAPSPSILTRTVVESPVVHWILPVRLRSAQQLDVAFVGDRFVQICELKQDGQLQNIIRKNDFGCRIRNARVIGSLPDSTKDGEDPSAFGLKLEDTDDICMADNESSAPPPKGRASGLPPQLLLVVLETGDCVFLFLSHGADGKLDFVISSFATLEKRTEPSNLGLLGFYATIDPSSRYMALACPQGLFVVYELESALSMNQRYKRNGTLNPIKTFRPRGINGIIHKIEFLYPAPHDDYHVILLLIVVRNGKSKMLTYEWEVGDDLKSVFAEEKRGHTMPPDHQMPLLIVPLTVRTAFFAISENTIGVCTDVLQGPPNFEYFPIEETETTELHHGLGKPIWTAWTRPYRLPEYSTKQDNIYLAREDGVIIFLDIDSDNILGASVNVGKFHSNISTAFASLFDDFADILIMGGDSGPGAIWQVPPRQPVVQLGTIANWSPTVDFVATDESLRWMLKSGIRPNDPTGWQDTTTPDRVFSASGRGITGTVTEFRNGFQASIGLDLETGLDARRSWLLPANLDDSSLGYVLLLSMPDRSVVLHLSDDFAQVYDHPPGTVPYDLSSRTLVASQVSEGRIVQVTENSVTFLARSESTRISKDELFSSPGEVCVDAAIYGSTLAISTHDSADFRVYLYNIEEQGVSRTRIWPMEGEITSLSLGMVNSTLHILAGSWQDDAPAVKFMPVTDLNSKATTFNLRPDRGEFLRQHAGVLPYPSSRIEAVTSIVATSGDLGETVIVAGTRSGEVFTLTRTLSPDHLRYRACLVMQKHGLAAANVFSSPNAGPGEPNPVFVCCGASLVLLANYDGKRRKEFQTRHRVFAVDASDLQKPSPIINSVTVLRDSLSGKRGNLPVLFLAGERVLLAEILPQAGPVQRHIPVGGTPLKIIYSAGLNCLIVGVMIDGKPTLKFLDPDTGEDLSRPTDQNGDPVQYVSGLGKPGDRIYGLAEWIYQKDGREWRFILVSTKEGRFITISTEKEPSADASGRGTIRYWTRMKKKGFSEPIYSVLGHAEGLIFCAGSTVHYEILDLVEKKMKPMKIIELESPVIALKMLKGKVAALTSTHSLQILDFTSNPGSYGMSRVHVDAQVRHPMHMIEIEGRQQEDQLNTIVLVSDRECQVTGLWVPWEQPGQDFEVLFQASLPASIRKFWRVRRQRAGWRQELSELYRRVAQTAPRSEILGGCLDGSIQHLCLLNTETWRLLRFVQNLAQASPLLGSFGHTEAAAAQGTDFLEWMVNASPLDMHVDGDVLQQCLDKKVVEQLFSHPDHVQQLKELLTAVLLDELSARTLLGGDGDGNTEAGPPDRPVQDYFDMLYDILEYYLAPVL